MQQSSQLFCWPVACIFRYIARPFVQLLDDVPANQMVDTETGAHASLIGDLESETEAHVT